MKKLVVVVVMATAGGLFTGPAALAVPEGSGVRIYTVPQQETRCGMTSMGGDVQTGWVQAGPIFASTVGGEVSIRCTVQVGPTGATHAGPDAAPPADSPRGPVAVLPPTSVTYVVPEGADVYLCTQIEVDGTVYYWDDTNGGYSTSSSVSCGLAISQEIDPDEGPVHEVFVILDVVICPVLAALFPPYGDLPGIWDCPPYN